MVEGEKNVPNIFKFASFTPMCLLDKN